MNECINIIRVVYLSTKYANSSDDDDSFEAGVNKDDFTFHKL
jgi:hypothetical protein